jgi:glycosyltransferase involved in cell wall biosynthesis
MIPVSVVILTKNEADNIDRCLKSVNWCDDIVLIDESTDSTPDLARRVVPENHLRVFQLSQTQNFAQLRNFALEHVKHDWVFFLDADEEVTVDLAKELASKISTADVSGFLIARRDYFLGKWLRYGETGQIKLLKLAKKDAGTWRRRVHEVWQVSGNIGTLNYPLNHFPHPSVVEFVARINRWTSLDADEFLTCGVHASWWKIIAYPVGKFVQNYIIRQGFRDGMPGLIMALCMSFHSFLTRAKLYQLERSVKS